MEENLKSFTSQEFAQLMGRERYEALANSMRKAVCNASPGRHWDESKRLSKATNKATNLHPKKKSNPKSWWDCECDEVIKERKTKLAQFKQTKELQDFINYKKARAYARKTINAKKKEDFIKFIQSINRFTSMKYVWNKIKVLKHLYRTIDWIKWQNKSRKEVIIKTIEENSPCWAQEAPIIIEYPGEHELNQNIMVEQVKRAIGCIRKNSSPGTDAIENTMIKLLP